MTRLSLLVLGVLLALGAASGCDRRGIESQKFVNRGVEALEGGQADVAFDFFMQAAELDPSNIQARYHLGLVYAYTKNDLELARKSFEEVLARDANDGDALYQMALLAMKRGKNDQARVYFEKSLPRVANPAAVHFGLAMLAQAANDSAELDKQLRQAIQKDSTYEDAYYELANHYLRYNDPERALQVVEEGLKIPPQGGQLHYLNAVLQKKAGRIQDAINALQKGLEKDPTNKEVYFDLGYFMTQLGNYREAIFHFKHYIVAMGGGNPSRVALARTLIDKLWIELDRKAANMETVLRVY